MAEVRSATVAQLDPTTLYSILRLRAEVFVVEQECAYLDLDGRDLEASAVQLWVERDGAVIATLRVLRETDGSARIGRVATAVSARGARLGAVLMQHALELSAGLAVLLDAQSYLVDWYASFGFEASGPQYLEDGIAHVPMRREPAVSGN
jgi:ElaA protein